VLSFNVSPFFSEKKPQACADPKRKQPYQYREGELQGRCGGALEVLAGADAGDRVPRRLHPRPWRRRADRSAERLARTDRVPLPQGDGGGDWVRWDGDGEHCVCGLGGGDGNGRVRKGGGGVPRVAHCSPG
jgi:hypothetical protein